MDLKKINQKIKNFVKERDWDQFHSPKNLSMALSVEVSELVEIFQWLKESDLKKVDKQKVADQKTLWQVVTTAGPILILLLIGIFVAFWRKKKYL